MLNALWWRPHPTHLSIAEAIQTAQELGARRTYLTHLTHETGHAELAGQLPEGIFPAYDGLTVEVAVIELAYGRMLQRRPRRRSRAPTRAAGRAGRPVRRGAGGGSPPAGGGRVRLLRAGGQDETVREITTFAEGLGQAHDHVLVLGIGGSALATKALLYALRRPAWNELDDEGREFFPRLTVLENVDPDEGRRGACGGSIPAGCWST